MCAGMVNKFGTEDQRAKYLPSMCRLDTKASYCLTEPGSKYETIHSATNLFTRQPLPRQRLGCRGNVDKSRMGRSHAKFCHQRNEGIHKRRGYVLLTSPPSPLPTFPMPPFLSPSSLSLPHSHLGMSDLYLVMCREGEGISCMLVPSHAEGLSFGQMEKKMGWHCQPTRQVVFENVRVPKENRSFYSKLLDPSSLSSLHRLGSEGQGFKMAMNGLDGNWQPNSHSPNLT